MVDFGFLFELFQTFLLGFGSLVLEIIKGLVRGAQ